MEVIETVSAMREYRHALTESVAMVATLGGMHAGHEAHLEKARELAEVTIGSLFLNPTQFAASEDLASYPQVRSDDLAMFEKYGVSAVFAPSASEMYPDGGTFTVDPGPIASVLEGAARPGHFKGVATVVAKLFSIIRPDFATFGEKDAQQLRIIEKLNRELMFGVEIVRIPTVREPDGLGMSTRNRYLDPDQRAAAPTLYRSLQSAKKLWDSGERSADSIRNCASNLLNGEPLLNVEYVSLADPNTFEEISGEENSGRVRGAALLSLAVRVGRARLIDNVRLD